MSLPNELTEDPHYGAVWSALDRGSLAAFHNLSPAARQYFLHLAEHAFAGTVDAASLDALYAVDYERRPALPEKFLDETDLAGHMGKVLFPPWREHFVRVCDPHANIYELDIAGGSGTGKCCRADTLIPTSQGLLTIEEVHRSRPLHALAETGVRRIAQYHEEGETETVRVVTRHGYELEGRPNHRVRVLDGGEIVWRELRSLRRDDVVLLAQGGDLWGADTQVSAGEAEVIGAWTGDGLYSHATAQPYFSVGPEKIAYAHARLLPLVDALGWEAWLRPEKNKVGQDRFLLVVGAASAVRARWDRLGLVTGAHNKHVPASIRRAPAEVVCAFLRGWFDTDGTVYSKTPIVEVTTVSERLAREAQLLLLNLGIRASRTWKPNDYDGAWTVRLLGKRASDVFAERIGFAHPGKAARFAQARERRNATEPLDGCRQLVSIAWSNLAGRVPSRKPYSSVYGGRKGRIRLTRERLARMVELGGVAHLPPALRTLWEGDLGTDLVTDVSSSRARCFDITVEDDPSYISNGFVSHNTFFAMLVLAYKLYVTSHLKAPALFFGLAPRSKIVFGIYALTKSLIKDVGFYDLRDQIIDQSPYFRDVFKRDKHGQEYIRWPSKAIEVIVGSSALHAISRNLLCVAADELNYYHQGEQTAVRARELVAEVSRRLETRFLRAGGSIPGIAIYLSQTRTKSDFLEQRIASFKARPDLTGIHVVRGPRWKFDPRPYRDGPPDLPKVETAAGPTPAFRVFTGTEVVGARILDRVVQRGDGTLAIEPINPDERAEEPTILVPAVHYRAFVDDIYGALRMIADVPSGSFTPFFTHRDAIRNAFDLDLPFPFKADVVPCYERGVADLSEVFDLASVTRTRMGRLEPIRHPTALRYIHLDPAINGDFAGMAMVHSPHHYRRDRHFDGESVVPAGEVVKDVEVDFYVALTHGPYGEPIDFLKIRVFIDWLRQIGYVIRLVTSDLQLLSHDMLQRLRDAGFATEHLSVDRTSVPYRAVRGALNERRVRIPYPRHLRPATPDLPLIERALTRVRLFQEMTGLEHDVQKDKIDHRETNPDGSKGSKDTCDGLVGAIHSCLTDEGMPIDATPTAVPLTDQRAQSLNRYLDILRPQT